MLPSSFPLFLIHKVLCPYIPMGGFLHPHPLCILSQVKRAWTLGLSPTVVLKKPKGKRLFTQQPISDCVTDNFWILNSWKKITKTNMSNCQCNLSEAKRLRLFLKVSGVKSKKEWSVSDCLLILWVCFVLQGILLLFLSMLHSLMPDGQREESCFKVHSIFTVPKGEKNKNKP